MKKPLLIALALSALAVPGAADSGSGTWLYLIAVNAPVPLCDLIPAGCPATAMADNGDTIEITGSGLLSLRPKSAGGGGTFTHKDAAGSMLGSGTWTATELISFNSYGPAAPDVGFPPNFEGGRVLIRVALDPGEPGGPTVGAVLEVVCRLPGDRGPAVEGQGEAVTLNIQDVINFNTPIHAVDLFVKQ